MNLCLGLIVHHTHAEREYAYDAKPKSTCHLIAALAEAADCGWIIVDMKKDWRLIFSEPVFNLLQSHLL